MNWYLYLYLLLTGTILVVFGSLMKKARSLNKKLDTTLNTTNTIKNRIEDLSSKTEYINGVKDKVVNKNSKRVVTGIVVLDSLRKILKNKEKNTLKNAVGSSLDILKIVNALK